MREKRITVMEPINENDEKFDKNGKP